MSPTTATSSSQASALCGVLPVFQTPWLQDESVDWDGLKREWDWLLECGANGVVMAMVSEVLRLDPRAREAMAQAACEHLRGRGSVVISVGAESHRVAQRLARHAQDHGATAVMAIPPVATALGEEELLAYYRGLLEAIEIPVIVQDASGYVGRPMSIAMQAQLWREFGPWRVQYKPEATPIVPRLQELMEATDGQARVFEGTGGAALPESFPHGVVGTMPGADLIRILVPLWRALQNADAATVSRLHAPLHAMIEMQKSLDAFLAVEKHLLCRQGIFENRLVRGPVGWRMDANTQASIDRLFDQAMAVLADLH